MFVRWNSNDPVRVRTQVSENQRLPAEAPRVGRRSAPACRSASRRQGKEISARDMGVKFPPIVFTINTTTMQKTAFLIILLGTAGYASAQDKEKSLPPFTKIVASPRVNVVLQKGDRESIRLTYSNVSPGNVNVIVTRNKLRIYLDHARVVEKQERIHCDGHTRKQSIYRNSSVTAFVTYRELKEIEVRGDQELTCKDEINTDKLKLRAYGETEIDLAGLNTKKFKASLYGENNLKIRSGEAAHQVYRLFGENKIDTRGLKSTSASTRIYGEGRLSLSASKQFVINAFGEPVIRVSGSPHVNKGIVIGRADIYLQ